MRTRRRRGLAVLVALLGALSLLVGTASCSGGGGGGTSTTTTRPDAEAPSGGDAADGDASGGSTTTTDTTDPGDGPAAYTAYRDPAQLATDPVAVGERFGLLLEARPSIGQRWQVVSPPDPAILTPLGTEITVANEAVPGSPDTQVFGYVGRAVGTTTVSFLEVKADGLQVDGALAVTFTITVTPDGLPLPVDEPDDESSDEGPDGGAGGGTGGT